jgi:hypothetical protein
MQRTSEMLVMLKWMEVVEGTCSRCTYRIRDIIAHTSNASSP